MRSVYKDNSGLKTEDFALIVVVESNRYMYLSVRDKLIFGRRKFLAPIGFLGIYILLYIYYILHYTAKVRRGFRSQAGCLSN